MKIRNNALLSLLILTGTTFTSLESLGQVDPVWLKNWNEAQENRPMTITSDGRIASESEPGIPFIIHGRVFSPEGTSAGGVVVHAYHRDSEGFDFGLNDNSQTTWRLQGWVETDSQGRFEFNTVRPAADHLGREGAHIHFTLESVDFGHQWAPKVFLSDDPLVTADQRRRSEEAGEYGFVREVQTINSVQHIEVRIQLEKKADF